MDNLNRYHLELAVNFPDCISLQRLVLPLELRFIARATANIEVCDMLHRSLFPYTERHRFRLRFADMFAKLTRSLSPEAWTGRGKFTVDTFEQVS